MPDFTIVIPHRGDGMGLWATISACEMDLANTKRSYNYVLVTNGEPNKPDVRNLLSFMRDSGKLKEHLHFQQPLTPPAARRIGVEQADSPLVFFFDNHCIPSRDYFERSIREMEHYDIPMLHSTTRFHAGDRPVYHYKLKLDYNFWAEGSYTPYWEHKPYQIAAGGHGGFVVRKEVFEAVGGYGPDSLLNGYGGEELIFDLKLWRMGYKVWLSPKVLHFHYAGVRNYTRHYTDEYYTNLLVSANVIGGEKWMYRLCDSFITKSHIRIGPKRTMYELMEDAYWRSVDYAKEVDSKSIATLDELLKEFRENSVCM